jgi:hypothetical protein
VVGMSDTPNRRSRRAAAATAPVAAATEAAADRAAIERDPSIDATAPAAVDAQIVPAAEVADNATVLPEPTLVAEPDKPMPIVTASPILAIEPSAIDVVKADGQADRVASGLEPARDPDGPHAAAAGQPTLTIEGDAVASALKGAIGGVSKVGESIFGERDTREAGRRYGFGDGVSNGPEYSDGDIEGFVRELTEIRDTDPVRFGRIYLEATGEPWPLAPEDDRVLPLEDITRGLEHLLLTRDTIAMDIIRTRFFDEPARAFGDAETRSAGPTVTVIEVIGPAQGRRRAGRSFGTQPQRFLAGELNQGEIEMLRSDPLLAVGISEVEADAFGLPIARDPA